MTVYRPPGGIEDLLDKALHRLSDADLTRVGLLRNTLAKQSNPNQPARISLEAATRIDALLLSRGEAAIFTPMAQRMLDQLLGALRNEDHAGIPVEARLRRIFVEMGDLTRAVDVSMQDGRLDLSERRAIAREAQDVIDHATALRDAVEPPAFVPITIKAGGQS